MKKAGHMYETALVDCSETTDVFEKLQQFQKDVLARPDAEDFIQANIAENKAEFDRNGILEISSWKDGNYFNSGMYTGIVSTLMGLTPSKDSDEDLAPAQFVAGWLYGITNDDKRDYIMSCYKSDSNLTSTLKEALDAYIDGD